METTIQTAIQIQGYLATGDELLEAIDDEDVQWFTDNLASEAYDLFDQDQIYIHDGPASRSTPRLPAAPWPRNASSPFVP
jgi:hypothetical protein